MQAPEGQTLTEPGRTPPPWGSWSPSWPSCPAPRRPATRWTRPRRPSTPTGPPATAPSPTPRAPGEVTPEQQDALLAAVDDARDTGLTVEVTGEAVQEPPHVGGDRPRRSAWSSRWWSWPSPTASLVLAGHEPAHRRWSASASASSASRSPPASPTCPRPPRPWPPCSAWPSASTTPCSSSPVPAGAAPRPRGRRRGRPPPSAPPAPPCVTAGLTVVIALAGLSVVGIPFLTQMGVAAAATVVVAVLVARHPRAGGARLRSGGARCRAGSGRRDRRAARRARAGRGFLARLGRHGHPPPGADACSLSIAVAGHHRRARPSPCGRRWCRPRPRTAPAHAPTGCSPTASARASTARSPSCSTAPARSQAAAAAGRAIAGLDDVAVVTPPVPERRRHRRAAHRHPRVRAHRPGHRAARRRPARRAGRHRRRGRGGHRRHRGQRRRRGQPQRRDAGLPGPRRRPGAGPARAGLPLAARAAGRRPGLPAHHRRLARRHRRGVPVGLAGATWSTWTAPDR